MGEQHRMVMWNGQGVSLHQLTGTTKTFNGHQYTTWVPDDQEDDRVFEHEECCDRWLNTVK